MKDVNHILRKALFSALQATEENVYYMQAPDNLTGNYIVFKVTGGTTDKMTSAVSVNVNSEITIYTEGQQYNDGDACDIIAGKVYTEVFPEYNSKLTLPSGFMMTLMDLVSDVTNTWRLKNQLIAIDRTITFTHKIYIE